MGSGQSREEQEGEATAESEEEEEEEEGGGIESREFLHREGIGGNGSHGILLKQAAEKKILQQEPEVLPCHPSASPLSPQLSSLGTPYLGPSIKVWDPCNVLYPARPPTEGISGITRCGSVEGFEEDFKTEVFLICHGECSMSLRPDLVGGRWPAANLTAQGKRQARALGVFLNSQGVRFNAVYCSPLERARQTAVSVCQELRFAEDQIQSSEALIEMSQGQWEGCPRAEIYTSYILSLMDRSQPDFTAPFGESLRQVEFRMNEFMSSIVLKTGQKLRSDYSNQNSTNHAEGFRDRDGPAPQWDLLSKQRHGIRKKPSGKSRLQYVKMGEAENDDESSLSEASRQSSEVDSKHPYCIGVFTHALPIKCLLTGLLGCSPVMGRKISIDDSSTTVIEHSFRSGLQIQRCNDTGHLRLL